MVVLKKVVADLDSLDTRITSQVMTLFESTDTYLQGVYSDNQSLRATYTLLLQLLTTMLKNISDTNRGLIDSIWSS